MFHVRRLNVSSEYEFRKVSWRSSSRILNAALIAAAAVALLTRPSAAPPQMGHSYARFESAHTLGSVCMRQL